MQIRLDCIVCYENDSENEAFYANVMNESAGISLASNPYNQTELVTAVTAKKTWVLMRREKLLGVIFENTFNQLVLRWLLVDVSSQFL